MKTRLFLTFLFACAILGEVKSQTLSIEGNELSNGSVWEVVPFNLVYTNSGSQIIYTADNLADLAGKNITGLTFHFCDGGSYIYVEPSLKIYIAETNRDGFVKSAENSRYRYFDISQAKLVFDGQIVYDGETYFYDDGDIEIEFDEPFYYSGDNNLLITLSLTGVSETTSGIDYANFYLSDLEHRALTFASESQDLLSDLANLYAPRYGVSVINAPAVDFSYEAGSADADTWYSYVPAYDADLDLVGIDAYKVTADNGDNVTIERVEQAKAGEPLIVRQNGVTPTFYVASAATKATDNLLKVSDGTVVSDGSYYALAKSTWGLSQVAAGVTIPAGKVYLATEGSSRQFIGFDGITTDIQTVQPTAGTVQSAGTFDLQGRQLTGRPTSRGLYIVGGRKMVVK